MNLITSTKGIGGEIKRRYEDFIVMELTNEHECRVEHFLLSEEEREKQWRKFEEKINELKELWKKEEEKKRGEQKDQLILEMEKFNLDLNQAIKFISRFLRVSLKRMGYAGMKDKRAITSQMISIWKPDFERLKKFKSRKIYLKPLNLSRKKIELGELEKNKFILTIRNISLNEKELKEIVEEFSEEIKKGIPNYFGEQRFGGAREVTHLVGKEFLKGNFKEAVYIYLTETFPEEEAEIRNARINLKKTNDFKQALKEFPIKFKYERAILDHLNKYPNDFIGAIRKLPRQFRFMFTHAFQSHLFNKIIERRFEEGYGLKEIEGDKKEDEIPLIQILGYDSKFSEGKAGEIEKEVLEKEGITLDQFKLNSFQELSSSGNNRKIAVFPEQFKLIEISKDEFFEGKLKAKIEFILPKGCYATVLLKELMKE